jgi:hypothetical protein
MVRGDSVKSDDPAFGPAKKQLVKEAETAAAWVVSKGTYNDKPLYARFNAAFTHAGDIADYPIQVGVAIPLHSPDELGLPASAELDELAEVEDLLVEKVAGQAVMVGAITTNSMREFVLYTDKADWIEGFDHAMQAAVKGHRVQVMAKTDPKWAVYSQFVN